MRCKVCDAVLFRREYRRSAGANYCVPCRAKARLQFQWVLSLGNMARGWFSQPNRHVNIDARLLVAACKAWRVTNETLQQGLSRDRSRGPGAHARTEGAQQ